MTAADITAALPDLTDRDVAAIEIAARQLLQRRERERRHAEEEVWRQKQLAAGWPECSARGCDNLAFMKGVLCLACIREARRLELTEQAYIDHRSVSSPPP